MTLGEISRVIWWLSQSTITLLCVVVLKIKRDEFFQNGGYCKTHRCISIICTSSCCLISKQWAHCTADDIWSPNPSPPTLCSWSISHIWCYIAPTSMISLSFPPRPCECMTFKIAQWCQYITLVSWEFVSWGYFNLMFLVLGFSPLLWYISDWISPCFKSS